LKVNLLTSKPTVTRVCVDCFSDFTTTPLFIGDREIRIDVCDDCIKKRQQESEQNAAAIALQARQNAFEEMCAPVYRESDLERIHGDFRQAVEKWEYSPQGLTLIGPAGSGKTRAAWWLIKKFHFSGKPCFGLTSTTFAEHAANQYHNKVEQRDLAEQAIHRCKRTKILLLDDLGKSKMTERAELTLYDLLEHRSSNMLPTIITSNADGKQLYKMLSEDRADPILRRIKDFSEVIKVSK
jgi:DNA replication protein DnaC